MKEPKYPLEPKINEVFELLGKHFRCIKDEPRQACRGCAFHPDDSGCVFMNCDKYEREDGENVIFKEVINDRD
jgi:hypothetical protein